MKLSTGFTGTDTVSLSELEKEVEYSLGRLSATKLLSAAGNAEDQEPADRLDAIEGKYQAKIKKPEDQFPGSPAPEKKSAFAKEPASNPIDAALDRIADEILKLRGEHPSQPLDLEEFNKKIAERIEGRVGGL